MFKLMKTQISPLINQCRRISFSLRSLSVQEPAYWFLNQPYYWWGQIKQKVTGAGPQGLRPDTELVIDGFQGSSNSFVVSAFKQSQTQHVKLAHHMHSPADIIHAIEQEIPVLLVVRDPEGAVLSLTSRWPHISVTQGLRSYIGFHNRLRPYAPHCVVTTFEQTTQHLDRVIQEVNAVFSTRFDLVDVAEANAKRKTHLSSNPEGLARRNAFKQVKRKELAAEKNSPLLVQANALYQVFEGLAQRTVKL